MLSCFGMKLKLVMMHRWDPETALRLIEAERVTAFVGVPTQSWDMLESPAFAKYDTSSLATVGGGGAPAPTTLVDRVEKGFRRGRPNIGYGMTETNAFGPGNNGDDYVTHPTSTGRARTTIMDVEIRDEAGRPVPVGERGQIWMKGPNLIRGYWNKPEATAEAIVDGWLASGDLGRIDEEGFLYIEDRAKDMVLRAGENVYCAEVESAIYEHPGVYEAAVFGVPDERLGEEVACVIQRKDGAEPHRRRAAGTSWPRRLAPFKIPSRIAFTDERLPRNPSGKILKRELRERVLRRTVGPGPGRPADGAEDSEPAEFPGPRRRHRHRADPGHRRPFGLQPRAAGTPPRPDRARHNPDLNAVVALDARPGPGRRPRPPTRPRRRAEPTGPLHGLPMTVKDVWETDGLVTTSGAPELRVLRARARTPRRRPAAERPARSSSARPTPRCTPATSRPTTRCTA